MKYNEVVFEEIFDRPLRNGFTKPKKIRGEGYPMINMGEIFKYDRISNQEMDKVPLTDKEKGNGFLNSGDLLFARQSLTLEGAGKVSIFLGEDDTTTFESHLIRVRLNKNKCCPLFYYYYFKSPRGKSSIGMIVEQVAAAGIRGSDLKKIPVPYIPKKEQERIAELLNIIDEKIEANEKAVSLLSKMSQTLFKHWFIDFEFPDAEGRPYKSSGGKMVESELGEIPEGWEVKSLKDLVSKFGTGLNPRKNFVLGEGDNFYVTIKNMSDDGEVILDNKCDKVTDEALIKINKRSDLRKFDVLFSGIGTIGRTHYILEEPKNWNISESIFTLRNNERITPEFLYLLISSKGLQNFAISSASGSVQKGIRKRDLESYKVTTPTHDVLDNFSTTTSKILEKINVLRKQNNILTTLRDTLLPKLISGELELPEENEVTVHEPV